MLERWGSDGGWVLKRSLGVGKGVALVLSENGRSTVLGNNGISTMDASPIILKYMLRCLTVPM